MSAEHPTPWHLQGYTIRDAKGGVVVSAIAPCNMATRRQIIKAVNGTGTPQRNCGRFATWNEAWIYWLRHSPKAISCEGGPIGFLDWLFDLYTEEGGAA